MKTKYPPILGLILAVIVGFSFHACAGEKNPTKKTIAAADQTAIKEIFKGVNPALYRLEFNGGQETMGSKKVTMDQIRQLRRVRNPLEEVGYVVIAIKDEGVMFIVAVTKGQAELEGVLGREKMARLNQVMAKYAR